MKLFILVLFGLTLLTHLRPAVALNTPAFKNVASEVGIQQKITKKYSGPIAADLDSDGHYDIILTYHQRFPFQIYFGSPNGSFTKSPFEIQADIHGVSVAPRTARSLDKLIYVAVGGRSGRSPGKSIVLLVGPDRKVKVISKQVELLDVRGRTSYFMNLALQKRTKRIQNLGGPDLLVANFIDEGLGSVKVPFQYAYQNVKGKLKLRRAPGFADEVQARAELTDIDGDGVMEIISFLEFRIYKLVSPFQFKEVSKTVAPGFSPRNYSINSVVEFDMDNDGDFDLYLARGFEDVVTNEIGADGKVRFRDILLENRGGKYFDVSRRSGIVGETRSTGVSAGDVNNDGFVDLIVTQFLGPDILLLNKGNRKFRQVDPKIPKPRGITADNTLAIDFDMDGRVDLITGQGDGGWFGRIGLFLFMRNVMPLKKDNHYLLVRVGNDPALVCTALHALVTVFTKRTKMVRRVASRGSYKIGGGSFFDIVHFGLGAATSVSRVTVRWNSGTTRSMSKVKADQKISIGRFLSV